MTYTYMTHRILMLYIYIHTQVSAFLWGKGAAQDKVCTVNAAFGTLKGLVHHSNERFGFYADNNW